MDDIIFERDYREAESGEYDEWCDEVFDRAVNGGMLKAYSDAMDKIPKIIIPEDKKNYEYLLERCDAFVERHRGRIEGIVDYHHWHSEINMFLPFAEFGDPEDLGFLKEIADKSHSICFSPDKDGGIRVHIFINYFDELMPEEAKQLEPEVAVTYFKADERKAGGAYLEATGIVKKLDDFERLITMQDGTKIPMDDILTIESDAFSSLEQY